MSSVNAAARYHGRQCRMRLRGPKGQEQPHLYCRQQVEYLTARAVQQFLANGPHKNRTVTLAGGQQTSDSSVTGARLHSTLRLEIGRYELVLVASRPVCLTTSVTSAWRKTSGKWPAFSDRLNSADKRRHQINDLLQGEQSIHTNRHDGKPLLISRLLKRRKIKCISRSI